MMQLNKLVLKKGCLKKIMEEKAALANVIREYMSDLKLSNETTIKHTTFS
ncbi:hypothetical protein ACV56Z_04620 [Staphylococcus aureus]